MGCDCIFLFPELLNQRGEQKMKCVSCPVAKPLGGLRAQGYRVKRLSACGGCLGDVRRRRTL
jgi:hypothetical protein